MKCIVCYRDLNCSITQDAVFIINGLSVCRTHADAMQDDRPTGPAALRRPGHAVVTVVAVRLRGVGRRRTRRNPSSNPVSAGQSVVRPCVAAGQSTRTGTFLVTVPPTARRDDLFYTALGYLVGKNAGDLVPVIDGIPDTPSTEDLKAFCAAVSTSGPVAMFHMVGVTPEAPTLHAALGGGEPLRTLQITTGDLLDAVHGLSTGEEEGAALDLVVLGSPHFTLGDFADLADLVEGRSCDPRVDVVITTSRFVLDQAVARGWAQTIEAFGARFSTDTCLCMLNTDLVPSDVRTVMTNSGKFAHYGPGLIQRDVWFGGLGDCVDSAVTGTTRAKKPAWAAS
jgi:predicted aconitase